MRLRSSAAVYRVRATCWRSPLQRPGLPRTRHTRRDTGPAAGGCQGHRSTPNQGLGWASHPCASTPPGLGGLGPSRRLGLTAREIRSSPPRGRRSGPHQSRGVWVSPPLCPFRTVTGSSPGVHVCGELVSRSKSRCLPAGAEAAREGAVGALCRPGDLPEHSRATDSPGVRTEPRTPAALRPCYTPCPDGCAHEMLWSRGGWDLLSPQI